MIERDQLKDLVPHGYAEEDERKLDTRDVNYKQRKKGLVTMSQIKWSDSMSVNNAVLDAQHKEWIAIYNRMDNILLHGELGQLDNAVIDAFKAMQEYASYHFRQEEEYMEEIGYPDRVMHKRMHTDFDDQLYNYSKEIRRGDLVLGTEVMSILKNWLLNHIMREDQQYCVFLTQKEADA
ncbi:hemerythrin-like metal-binding domain-containing protein [Desulfocapsa sulfexigens DSM 10523]|uniref:Hemerythrin-like metal-binding domain-containing protein n=2 Tax=Desulfocapsa TaxID=53318 RepID=M1P3C1_DESSD|nr:hemerythrin-like metal-binding domain-containing protein [Desulfocapsa sulfexigens DSM 10523]